MSFRPTAAALSDRPCSICRWKMHIAYVFTDGSVILVCARCDRA